MLWNKMQHIYPDPKSSVCSSQWSNKQYYSIDTDNGSAPNRRQAIIYSNDVLSTDA